MATLLLLLEPYAAAHSGTLFVTIEGLHSAAGHVYVALFSRPDGFPDGNYSYRHMRIKASTQPLTVVFDDIPRGSYAAGAYRDENDNQRLDTNFFGYPVEGYALSNGVRANLCRPRFVDAAFRLGDGGGRVVLNIQY